MRNKIISHIKFLIIFFNFLLLSSFNAMSEERLFKEINPNLISNFEILDENKKKISFNEIFSKKKFNLVNFWATWCLPCKKELPDLERMIKLLDNDKIKFYIISVDKKNINEQLLFLKNNNIKELIPLFDPHMKIFNHLKLRGIPTTIIINKQGYAFKKHEGILKYNEKIIREINELIN